MKLVFTYKIKTSLAHADLNSDHVGIKWTNSPPIVKPTLQRALIQHRGDNLLIE